MFTEPANAREISRELHGAVAHEGDGGDSNRGYRIPGRDEADLSWFFGPGAAYFEKSTFGIMLERAIQFGQHTEPCETCGGLGFLELTAEEMVSRAAKFEELAAARRSDDALAGRSDDEIDRVRELRKDEHKSISAEATCPGCAGSKYERSRLKLRVGTSFACTSGCPKCKGRRRDRAGEPCVTCEASGYVVPVTANPKGGSTDDEGWCPDDEALVRYALVSRRLDRLSESAFEALKLFYGDRGSRWAGKVQGRLLALYPLTPAGAKLAARGITREMRDTLGELGLRLDEAIWNECEAQRATPTANRKQQLEKAHAQAGELLYAASLEWRDTGPAQVMRLTDPESVRQVETETANCVPSTLAVA
jgi:hypothetical protein